MQRQLAEKLSIPEKARRLRRAVRHEMRYLPQRCKGSFSDDLLVQETLVPTVPTVRVVYACVQRGKHCIPTTYLSYLCQQEMVYSVHMVWLQVWLHYLPLRKNIISYVCIYIFQGVIADWFFFFSSFEKPSPIIQVILKHAVHPLGRLIHLAHTDYTCALR